MRILHPLVWQQVFIPKTRSQPLLAIPLVSGGPQSRPGVGVAGVGAVEVELDTRVVAGVQRGASNTVGGSDGAAAGDADGQALRVVLGTVVAASAVQGDDLVAEDIVAGLEVAGEGGGGGEVVGDELVSHPGLAADDGALAELGPSEVSGRSLAC